MLFKRRRLLNNLLEINKLLVAYPSQTLDAHCPSMGCVSTVPYKAMAFVLMEAAIFTKQTVHFLFCAKLNSYLCIPQYEHEK